MPYSQKELKEIADQSDEDPTMLTATTVPGAAETDDDGKPLIKYTPVTIPNEETYVRRPDSTLDWKNYRFTMTMADGTSHDFLFTAKDDGDAQRKVRERVAATNHGDGTFKLVRLEAPKELDLGDEFGGGETVDETSDGDKKASAEKRQKAAKEQDAKATEGAAKTAEAQAAAKKADAKRARDNDK